jgi:predicted MFS family arabinose efflux permease
VDRRRLHARACHCRAQRGLTRRPLRPPPHLRGRDGAVHGLLAGLCARPEHRGARRRSCGPGYGGGDAVRELARPPGGRLPVAGRTSAGIPLNGATIGASFAVGPLVGGALTGGFSWRAVFYVNLPLGILAIVASIAWLRESNNPAARRLDWAGQTTLAAGLFLLVLALLRGNQDGWGTTPIIAELGGGGALLLAFLLAERRTREPMLPLGLFRHSAFTGAQVVAFSISASFFALFLYITLYPQEVLHLSPVDTGLVYLPGTIVMFVVSAASAQLADRTSPGVLITAGMILVAAGLA